MSQAASQAATFYRDVAAKRAVYTLRDSEGFPAPKGLDGRRSMPFWSSRSRVERIIATVPAYAGFEPVDLTWDEFCSRWAPGLEKDGCLVGVNWSGPRAVGYDIEPSRLLKNVNAAIERA
jgi:hypothetical protein